MHFFLTATLALLPLSGAFAHEGDDDPLLTPPGESSPGPWVQPTMRPEEQARQEFAAMLERLTRQHQTQHGDGGHPDVARDILRELQGLPRGQQLRMMNYFLDVSQHYQAMRQAQASGDLQGASQHRDAIDGYRRTLYALGRSNPVIQDLVLDMRFLATGRDERSHASREAADNFPSNARAQNAAAQDLMSAGNLRDGITYADRAVQLDPNNAGNLSTRAQLKAQMKDYDGALQDARHALELDPNDLVAQAILRLTRGQRLPTLEIPDARPQNQRYDPIPESPPSGLARAPGLSSEDYQNSMRFTKGAQAALRSKDYAESVRNASLAIKANPKNLEAQYLRGAAYAQAGQLDSALRDAQQGLAAAPADAKAPWLVLLANVLNRMKDYPRAAAAARMAVAAAPKSAEAHLSLAWALGGMGERDAALRELRQAAQLDSRYASYYDQATRLPGAANLAMLFEGGADAPAPPPAPKRRSGGLVLILLSLVGGGLAAAGFLHVFSGPGGWRTQVGTVLRRQTAADAGADGHMPGSLHSLYQVTRQIGTGGMGVVYEALDKNLKRRVAIKQMRPEIRSDARERARFLDEARLVAALKHPSIVEIYSIVEEGPDAYLVFEYVDGKTVSDLMHEKKRLALRQALPIVRDVAAALDYAHGRGIIHRDLKPSNVMVDESGRAKVMDFGVARQAKDSLSRLSMTSTIAGTPPYMAPEQEQGLVRKESDVYALAVCLYEMLTGKLPFNGVGAGMLMAKINKTFLPPSSLVATLPKELDAVFSRALDPDPDKRWRAAADFVKALEPLA